MANEQIKSYTTTSDVNVDSNISENAATITDSKAKLIYRDFFIRKFGVGLFSTSTGIFASLLVTLLTSTFNVVFGNANSPFVMKGIFWTICVLSGLLALGGLALMIIGHKKYNEKAFIKALHNKKEE